MRRYVIAAIIAGALIITIAAGIGVKFRRMSSYDETRQTEHVSMMVVSPNERSAQGAPAPKAPSSSQPSLAAPQIARTAKITLLVPSVEDAAGTLSALAHRQYGDVFALEVQNASAPAASNPSLQLRVPADRFDDTMARIAKVGKVRDRSVSAQDLTGDISDSSARLRNLRRTESDILKIMDRSGTVDQVLEAENQLSTVREQIETLESGLKTMHGQVAYSTIDIDMLAEGANAAVDPSPASQIAGATQAAVHALVQFSIGLVGMLVWLAVFTPYLAAIALIAYLGYRRVRRTA
jgi:hypothetical protein